MAEEKRSWQMSSRNQVKMALDVAMYALMLFLLSYPLTLGLMRHGVCGFVLLLLFILHHVLNISWYRSLAKGKWNFQRILLTGTNCLLMLVMMALFASSLAMAGEVFSFAPFPMTYWGRDLHRISIAWSFALISFHIGLHGQKYWNRFWRYTGRFGAGTAAILLGVGAFLFVSSGIWKDMILHDEMKAIPSGITEFLCACLGTTMFFCFFAQTLLKLQNLLYCLLNINIKIK